MTVNFLGLMGGQMLFTTGRATSFALFSLSAIFYAICLIPMGLTRLAQPKPAAVPQLRPWRLFRIAPVGVAGCVAVGFANGAVWTLAPVYAQDHGITRALLAVFMVAFTAGGALFQVPLGRLSDRVDRRYVIAIVALLAGIAGVALALFGGINSRNALFLVALFGAMALPLYGLSVAHANDRLPREMFIEASATLLFLNAFASVLGPTIAALITVREGSSALFLYTAAVHFALAIFAFARLRVAERPSEETREPYAPVPQATVAALELDPRGPEAPEAEPGR
jgi:MFS family permease